MQPKRAESDTVNAVSGVQETVDDSGRAKAERQRAILSQFENTFDNVKVRLMEGVKVCNFVCSTE
jgi:hypothetical protein